MHDEKSCGSLGILFGWMKERIYETQVQSGKESGWCNSSFI